MSEKDPRWLEGIDQLHITDNRQWDRMRDIEKRLTVCEGEHAPYREVSALREEVRQRLDALEAVTRKSAQYPHGLSWVCRCNPSKERPYEQCCVHSPFGGSESCPGQVHEEGCFAQLPHWSEQADPEPVAVQPGDRLLKAKERIAELEQRVNDAERSYEKALTRAERLERERDEARQANAEARIGKNPDWKDRAERLERELTNARAESERRVTLARSDAQRAEKVRDGVQQALEECRKQREGCDRRTRRLRLKVSDYEQTMDGLADKLTRIRQVAQDPWRGYHEIQDILDEDGGEN